MGSSVCSWQERNTWERPPVMCAALPARHRIRAAWAVPATRWSSRWASTARCLSGPGVRCTCCCFNRLNSSAHHTLQLKSDRCGQGFEIHQLMLTGDSKELLFALKNSPSFPLNSPFGNEQGGQRWCSLCWGRIMLSEMVSFPVFLLPLLLSPILLLTFSDPWWFRVSDGP